MMVVPVAAMPVLVVMLAVLVIMVMTIVVVVVIGVRMCGRRHGVPLNNAPRPPFANPGCAPARPSPKIHPALPTRYGTGALGARGGSGMATNGIAGSTGLPSGFDGKPGIGGACTVCSVNIRNGFTPTL